jgi:hypothetical protein
MNPSRPLAVGQVVYVLLYDGRTGRPMLTGARIRGKQPGFNHLRPGWIAVELCEDRGDGNDYGIGDVITRPASMLYTTREISSKWTLEKAGVNELPEVRVDRYQIVPEASGGTGGS